MGVFADVSTWSFFSWFQTCDMELWPVEVTPATAATRMWRNNKNCCYLDVILTKDHQELIINNPISRTPIKKININHHQTKKSWRQQATILFFWWYFRSTGRFFFGCLVRCTTAPLFHRGETERRAMGAGRRVCRGYGWLHLQLFECEGRLEKNHKRSPLSGELREFF